MPYFTVPLYLQAGVFAAALFSETPVNMQRRLVLVLSASCRVRPGQLCSRSHATIDITCQQLTRENDQLEESLWARCAILLYHSFCSNREAFRASCALSTVMWGPGVRGAQTTSARVVPACSRESSEGLRRHTLLSADSTVQCAGRHGTARYGTHD